ISTEILKHVFRPMPNERQISATVKPKWSRKRDGSGKRQASPLPEMQANTTQGIEPVFDRACDAVQLVNDDSPDLAHENGFLQALELRSVEVVTRLALVHVPLDRGRVDAVAG